MSCLKENHRELTSFENYANENLVDYYNPGRYDTFSDTFTIEIIRHVIAGTLEEDDSAIQTTIPVKLEMIFPLYILTSDEILGKVYKYVYTIFKRYCNITDECTFDYRPECTDIDKNSKDEYNIETDSVHMQYMNRHLRRLSSCLQVRKITEKFNWNSDNTSLVDKYNMKVYGLCAFYDFYTRLFDTSRRVNNPEACTQM